MHRRIVSGPDMHIVDSISKFVPRSNSFEAPVKSNYGAADTSLTNGKERSKVQSTTRVLMRQKTNINSDQSSASQTRGHFRQVQSLMQLPARASASSPIRIISIKPKVSQSNYTDESLKLTLPLGNEKPDPVHVEVIEDYGGASSQVLSVQLQQERQER